MSRVVFQRTVQRIQIEKQPRTYRIMTAGQGPAGPVGGASFVIHGVKATTDDLPETGEPGDAWKVSADGHIYVWNKFDEEWDDIGEVSGTAIPILAMTQAEYDDLDPPPDDTFIIIHEEE